MVSGSPQDCSGMSQQHWIFWSVVREGPVLNVGLLMQFSFFFFNKVLRVVHQIPVLTHPQLILNVSLSWTSHLYRFKSPGSRGQRGEQHRPDEDSGPFFGS